MPDIIRKSVSRDEAALAVAQKVHCSSVFLVVITHFFVVSLLFSDMWMNIFAAGV